MIRNKLLGECIWDIFLFLNNLNDSIIISYNGDGDCGDNHGDNGNGDDVDDNEGDGDKNYEIR